MKEVGRDEPNLRLKIKRVRKVDFGQIGGGICGGISDPCGAITEGICGGISGPRRV